MGICNSHRYAHVGIGCCVCVRQAGQVVVQKQFNVCATVDHRICDGATLGRMAQYIKHVLENEPHRLEEEDTTAASSSHAHPAPPTRG